MKADMHVHSNYSDGSDTVEEVIKKAKANGMTHLSFVDHDTTKELELAQALGKTYGIKIIPGIEISAYDFKRNRKVHMLGYNYDPDPEHIRDLCEPLLKRRHELSLWQIERIREEGFHLDPEKVIETAKPSNTVYKQHIMRHLTDAPYTSEKYQMQYKRLFKGGGAADRDIEYVDAFDAARAIIADGGTAVVAHPGQLDSFDIIPELAAVGLGGVERNHMDHSTEDIKKVEELAQAYNLCMTGGTDYHGSFGKKIDVGDIISPKNYLLEEIGM